MSRAQPWLGVPGHSKSAAALAVILARAVCCGSIAKPAEPAWNLEGSSTLNAAEIHTHEPRCFDMRKEQPLHSLTIPLGSLLACAVFFQALPFSYITIIYGIGVCTQIEI